MVARRGIARRNPARWLRTSEKCLNHVGKRFALLIDQLVNPVDAKFGVWLCDAPGSSSTKRSQPNVACEVPDGRRRPRAIAAKEGGCAHGDGGMQERVKGTNPGHGDCQVWDLELSNPGSIRWQCLMQSGLCCFFSRGNPSFRCSEISHLRSYFLRFKH